MEKIWLKHYSPGVPHEINPDQYTCITHLLEDAFRKYGDRPFASCMGSTLRFSDLDHASYAFAAWVQHLGLRDNAKVAIMLPNVLQYPVVMAGVIRAGYTIVNVNPLYTARELEHQLVDSDAEVIIILENFLQPLQDVLARTKVHHVVVATMGDMLGPVRGPLVNFVVRHVKKLVPLSHLTVAPHVDVHSFKQVMQESTHFTLHHHLTHAEDIAFLQYTGGTTGLSKGAMLSHRNVIAATLQAEAWFAPAYQRPPAVTEVHTITALPLYHIFALTLCLFGIRAGFSTTLIPNPRDIKGLISELKKQPFHIFPAVNTLFNAILNHPLCTTVDWSSLRLSQAGGMAAAAGTAERWHKTTGSPMIEGWGMSETVAVGTDNPVHVPKFTGNIGIPFPSIDLRILGPQDEILPPGQVGEIAIKGPNVMKGYYKQPEENARVFTADGFLRTGDVGVMDENGFTRIVDRKKDMVIVSGFNVYPNEIENVLSTCPGILESAVIGVPDEHSGEAIKVFIVKSDPQLTEASVRAYCDKNLTGYKHPKYIVFKTDLPKTNVGKILRRALRD